MEKIKSSNISDEKKTKKINRLIKKTTRRLKPVQKKAARVEKKIRDLSKPLAKTPKFKMNP